MADEKTPLDLEAVVAQKAEEFHGLKLDKAKLLDATWTELYARAAREIAEEICAPAGGIWGTPDRRL